MSTDPEWRTLRVACRDCLAEPTFDLAYFESDYPVATCDEHLPVILRWLLSEAPGDNVLVSRHTPPTYTGGQPRWQNTGRLSTRDAAQHFPTGGPA